MQRFRIFREYNRLDLHLTKLSTDDLMVAMTFPAVFQIHYLLRIFNPTCTGTCVELVMSSNELLPDTPGHVVPPWMW